jgi:hypothetical protein
VSSCLPIFNNRLVNQYSQHMQFKSFTALQSKRTRSELVPKFSSKKKISSRLQSKSSICEANHEDHSDCTITSFSGTDNTTLPLSTNPNPSRTRVLLLSLPRLNISPFKGPKFTVFPQLPIERRNKIWRHASEFPQTINLYGIGRWEGVKHSVSKFYSTPPVLHASSESRAEALRHYQRLMHKIDTGCTFDTIISRFVSTWKD